MIDVWIPSSREREGNREHWERAARRRESIEESINSQSSNPCTREIRGPTDFQKIMFRKLCTQSISQNASPPTKFGIRNAPLSLFLSLYRPLSLSTDMCTYIYTLWESREFLEIVSRDLSANRTAIRSCHGCLFDSIRNSGKELWAKSIRIVDSSRLTHILPERKKRKEKAVQHGAAVSISFRVVPTFSIRSWLHRYWTHRFHCHRKNFGSWNNRGGEFVANSDYFIKGNFEIHF